MIHAGFWKRFAAFFIDLLVVVVISAVAGGILGFVYGVSTGFVEGAEYVGQIGGILSGWIYYASFESSAKQATLGKMALNIKVTDMAGCRIGFGRATGRHFAKFISGIILLIGYLMVAFTPKKQGLHDLITGCVVIDKS